MKLAIQIICILLGTICSLGFIGGKENRTRELDLIGAITFFAIILIYNWFWVNV